MGHQNYIDNHLNLSKKSPDNSTQIGRQAEYSAVQYLKDNGFDIVKRNWSKCGIEIDIIAQKALTIYFVEVKYRRNSNAGDGEVAISKSKVQRMIAAAQCWQNNSSDKFSIEMMAIVINGETDSIETFEIIY